MKTERTIDLAGRKIGSNNPCFIIAEAGVNHNGQLQMAHDLIDAAADSGADAVKFQTWITELLCQPGTAKADYQQTNSPEAEDQFTMLKKLELPYAWHAELKQHAQKRGILFLSTPDEIQSARFLVELGISAIKIGSGELTNLPFLRQLAAMGKPLILSTGMGNLEEVNQAMRAVRDVSDVPVALLHCVSAYPAPEAEMNLRSIATLRNEFKVPTGLSDHTPASFAASIGVGIGMDILEKHITLDRSLIGPDHAASSDPKEFAELVRTVRKAELMLGTGVKTITESELNTRKAVQRTLVYTKDLPANHVLTSDDMEALRTGQEGLPPAAMTRLAGRVLQRSIRTGSLVIESDFK